MKRVLFSLLAMFAVGSLWAQSTVEETNLSWYNDVLYAKSITVMKESADVTLPIYSKTHADFTAVSFYVVMPEGSKVTRAVSLNSDAYNSDKDQVNIELESWAGNEKEDGSFMVVGALASKDFSENKLGFYSGDHELGTLKIDVSKLEVGVYPVIIKNAHISKFLDGTADVEISDDIVSKLIITDRIILDENEREAPAATTEAKKVQVKRSMKKDVWNTLCLPFDMTIEQVSETFGDDVAISEYVSCSPVIDEEFNVTSITVNFDSPTLRPIKANIPYIIKISSPITYEEGFVLDNVIINPSSQPISEKTTRGKFYGTYVATDELGKDNHPVLLISDNKFYIARGNSTLKAFRGYIQPNALDDYIDYLESPQGDSNAKINLAIDETTAIEGINTNQRVIDGVYDLQGRKVMVKDGDINNLQRGLYIINGKKVAIK